MDKIKYKTNKQIKNTKILILSDIHYSEKTEDYFLVKLYLCCARSKPDYILIVGDLFEHSKIDYLKMATFLGKIGKIAPILIAIRNHDLMYKNNNRWTEYINYDMFSELNQIENINVLNNNIKTFNDLTVTGYTKPFKGYEEDTSYDYFKKDFEDKIKFKVPEDKLNILMCHSPENIILNKNDINFLDNVDLVISGHMHGGLIPKQFDKLLKGTGGLISPEGKLLPKYTRGTINLNGTTYYINRPVTTFSGDSILSRLNPLYGIEMAELEISKVLTKRIR